MKRIISLLLCACMMAACIGCTAKEEKPEIQNMEIVETPSCEFPILGGRDIMPIAGFYGPTPPSYTYNANKFPDYYSDEFFELMAQSGINMICYSTTNYNTAPSYALRMLEQGEKYGLGVVVNDAKLLSGNLTLEQMDERINEYANYPAFCGLYLVDEPGSLGFRPKANANISDFKQTADMYNELGYSFYANLYGTLPDTTDEVYAEYVREFAEELNPPYYLFDRYIFDDNSGLTRAPELFQCLEAVRAQAEKDNKPFWFFVQAGAQWNDAKNHFDSNGYFPSRSEFMWSVNVGLAYGAKGLTYFPLLQPTYFAYALTEPFDFQRNGLIGAAGNKTRWYYYAQEANAQIRLMDEILMNATNVGMLASGKDATVMLRDDRYYMEGTAWRELESFDGDTMVGCFNYLGKSALYVVNYDINYAQNIHLDFVDNYNVTVMQGTTSTDRNCDGLTLDLGAGEGALIVFR